MYDKTSLPLSPTKVLKKSLPTILLSAILWVGALFVYLFVAKSASVENTSLDNPGLMFSIITICLVLFLLFTLIYQYLYYKLYNYQFNESDAQISKGVLTRATGHVNYGKLQNIYVDQDFLDLIFGLYDVHYETAGETSGFYSHIDGLKKENSDKLVSFLKSRMGTPQNVQRSTQSYSQNVPSQNVQTTKKAVTTEDSNQIVFDRNNCPISSKVIVTSSITDTVFIFFCLFFVLYAILMSLGESRVNAMGNSGLLLVYIMLLVVCFALAFSFEYISFKNLRYQFGNEQAELRNKVIGQSTTYLYYNRIQNVNVNQSIWGRLLNLYCLSIETAGKQMSEKFVINGLNSDNADKLKNFLLDKAKSFNNNL